MKIKTVKELEKEMDDLCAQYPLCKGCLYEMQEECIAPFMHRKMVEHVEVIRAEIESARRVYIHLIPEDAASQQSSIDVGCVRGLDIALAIIDKESE